LMSKLVTFAPCRPASEMLKFDVEIISWDSLMSDDVINVWLRN